MDGTGHPHREFLLGKTSQDAGYHDPTVDRSRSGSFFFYGLAATEHSQHAAEIARPLLEDPMPLWSSFPQPAQEAFIDFARQANADA